MQNDNANEPSPNERGEIMIELDGQPMVLRPSYDAIVAFEQLTGKGLMELTETALAGKLTLPELAQIISECLRAWGRETGDRNMAGSGSPRVGRLILEAPKGMAGAMGTVAAMLSLAVTGGLTAEGKVRPTTMTMTPEPVVAG